METVALKDVPSVEGSIIVNQQNITWFHTQSRNMFFASSLNLHTILQTQRFHGIGIKDFRHSHLRDTARTAISQFACVIVCVIEPDGETSDRVTIDGRFRNFDSLQTTRLSVCFKHHFQVHIKLGSDRSVDQSLDSFLHKPWQTGRQIQVTHGDSNFAIVQLLQEFSVEFRQNGCPVGDQKSTPTLSSLLKADKGGIGSRALCCGLAMKSNVMTTKGWFVDLLVKGISLGGKFSQSRRMKRIQTGFQLQGFVHFSMSLDRFHEIKSTEPNGAVFQKLLPNLVLVFSKVFCSHGVVLVGGTHFEWTVWHFGSLLLSLNDVDSLGIPLGKWTFPHSRKVRF
mmetsp:Transcript_19572/g.34416  ORF Transcript_19572/g.34416 Transcript_19572/m.34416 type:complete len:339 (+) Transcript_19572:291-1307(+)